jgi:hypothetical protein
MAVTLGIAGRLARRAAHAARFHAAVNTVKTMDGAWVLRDPAAFDAAAASFRAARVQHAFAHTVLRRGAAGLSCAIAAEASAGGVPIKDRGDFTKLYLSLVLDVPSLASAYSGAELDEFKRLSLPASVRFGRPLPVETRSLSRRLVNHMGYSE